MFLILFTDITEPIGKQISLNLNTASYGRNIRWGFIPNQYEQAFFLHREEDRFYLERSCLIESKKVGNLKLFEVPSFQKYKQDNCYSGYPKYLDDQVEKYLEEISGWIKE